MADGNNGPSMRFSRDSLLTNPLEVDRLVSKYRLMRPLVVHAIVVRGPSRNDVESYLELLAANLT